jgi:glycosyltransferase involved in cell wall biosynthesis
MEIYPQRVSCLMLTERRLEEFRKSFACFCNQDYSNKELVVLASGNNEYQASIRACVESSGRKDVRCTFVRSKKTLGALRNLAIEQASGPLICQWDDDDLYHPQRLTVQVKAMQRANAEASFLFDNFHLFREARHLYWLSWTRSQSNMGLPGSLLAYKHVVPRYDETLNHHEDTLVQHELQRQKVRTSLLSGLGYLYTYVFHGANTFGFVHHATLTKKYGLEKATLRERAQIIRTALEGYPLQRPLSVRDQVGEEAFVWEEQEASEFDQNTVSPGKIFVMGRRRESHERIHAS